MENNTLLVTIETKVMWTIYIGIYKLLIVLIRTLIVLIRTLIVLIRTRIINSNGSYCTYLRLTGRLCTTNRMSFSHAIHAAEAIFSIQQP